MPASLLVESADQLQQLIGSGIEMGAHLGYFIAQAKQDFGTLRVGEFCSLGGGIRVESGHDFVLLKYYTNI